MKAKRGWILAMAMLAACSDALTGPNGKLPEGAVAVITPTNNTACNKFWVGSTNGLWTDPARWSPAGVPSAGSSVCINAAGTYTVILQPISPATAITVDILALDVGGTGAVPTVRLGTADVTLNIAEGVVVQQNAVLRLNNSGTGIINAAETITNSGTLEGIAPCGSGCLNDHRINADIINLGTLRSQATVTLGKLNGQYENTGTIDIPNGSIVIPASAGNPSFSQDAGVISGNSNFPTLNVRAGTFTMIGGKARQRAAANLKPVVIVEGANLVLTGTATDTAIIGVLATSNGNTTITGSVPTLTTLWLGGPADLQPGAITFNDATPVNHGAIRLGTIDGGEGVLTLAGTGRLTNADSLFAPATGSAPNYHFALEVTNSGTLTLGEDMTFEKSGGTYYNAGLINGSGTLHITGSTLVSTATGTVSPTHTSGAPNFRVDGGRLMGIGTLGDITLTNGATIEPGVSPGILNGATLIATDPSATALEIELGGTQVGIGYDQLNLAVSQSVSTGGGSLDVLEINGFLSGVCGQVFEVLTWNSTSAGFTNYTGLNPGPTRALRVFTHTASLPRKTILYGYDPTAKISVAPNPVAIAEGGAGVQYAVCLDGSPALTTGQTVTVTPTPNAQVTVSPPSVTFTSANWRAPQFLTVTAVDDNVIEGNHTGTATNASTSNVAAYNGVAIASLTANITDNDALPQIPTTTSVGSSVNPSTFGQSVTFTATVTSGAGSPAGTVQFNIDGNDVGSPATLDGNGQATYVTATLGVGNHPVQATYAGNASFAGSNGALTGGQVVNLNGTSTSVVSSQDPSTFGQSVTFTATVSSGAGTPTGNVQFSIDGSPAGAPVALVSGQATHVTSALTGGNHSVSAAYAGNATYAASNGALGGGQDVNPAGTTTAVASSANPSTSGQDVTFTATVTSGAGTPTGTIQFNIDGNPAGAAVPLDANGQAAFSTSALGVGNHPVQANFSGSTNYAAGNGALSGGQTVNEPAPGSTTTTVQSSVNPSTFGQSVTFTATVSSNAGTPSGNVQFSIDGNPVGGAVALVNGQATHMASALTAGSHSVSVSYGGNATYAGSNGSLAGGQNVSPAGTSTAVSSNNDPSTYGQSVTFTATVTSGAGTPSGSVHFNIDGSDVGPPVALNESGQATFVLSSLGAGTHVIKATYGAAGNYASSFGLLTGGQQVSQAGSTTTVTSSANPSTVGQSVTFTATVSSGAGTPTGTVQFSIDGSPAGGPVSLAAGQATFSTGSLIAGNHTVAAAYSGSGNFQSSNGALSGGQKVNEQPTGTGVGQPGIDITEVVIVEAFTSGPDQNEARGRFTILNSSSGPATAVTLGTVTVTFRSNKPSGPKTNHTATCSFAPIDPTGDVLAPQQAKIYTFDCSEITPSLLSNASELTATATVVNVSNQLGQLRTRTWTKNSSAYRFP